MKNLQSAEIQESEIQDVMNRMIYLPENGQIEISQDVLNELKRRYAILLIKIAGIKSERFMYLPENYIIDLNKFMQSLNEYYDECEKIKTGAIKCKKHKILCRFCGIPTEEQLSRGMLPESIETIESIATKSGVKTSSVTSLLRTAIWEFKTRYWNDFFIYDLTIVQTSNGEYKLEEVPIEEIPVVALRPYFYKNRARFDLLPEIKTIGMLHCKKKVIEEFIADRPNRIERFRSMIVENASPIDDVVKLTGNVAYFGEEVSDKGSKK